MKDASFNPAGSKLWITLKMTGLYYMPYSYLLWGTADDSPAVLTNPIRHNNNQMVIDDYYNISNDYKPGEALEKYHRRVVQVSLDVIKMDSDDGYELTVNIWQCAEGLISVIMANLYQPDFDPPIPPLAADHRAGKVGSKQLKEEKFYFMLKDITQ